MYFVRLGCYIGRYGEEKFVAAGIFVSSCGGGVDGVFGIFGTRDSGA